TERVAASQNLVGIPHIPGDDDGPGYGAGPYFVGGQIAERPAIEAVVGMHPDVAGIEIGAAALPVHRWGGFEPYGQEVALGVGTPDPCGLSSSHKPGGEMS